MRTFFIIAILAIIVFSSLPIQPPEKLQVGDPVLVFFGTRIVPAVVTGFAGALVKVRLLGGKKTAVHKKHVRKQLS